MEPDRCVARTSLASQFATNQESKFISVFKLAILSARQSPQARKSVPIWDEFCAVPPARSISPPRWEEWQGLAINIANPFTKKMVIRMDFEGRRRSSQPLSSPFLKPGASRSFFGHFSGSGYFGSK